MDTTLFTFNILRKGAFSIEHYRFIAVFTELVPLLASKLSASLKGVLLGYSFGFWVCFFICYLLCGAVFRKYHYALGILLINTLLVTEIFYWPISELPLGLALLLTIMAFLEDKSLKQLNTVHFFILAVFTFTLAFAHPLMMFPASFGLLFLYLGTTEKSRRSLYVAVAAFFIFSVAIKQVFFKEDYDNSSMHSIVNFKTLFPNYFDLTSNRTFFKAFLTKFYWIPLCTILIVSVYLYSKNWLKLGLFLAYLVGYTLLINVCYHTSDASLFYIENLYQPLAIILAVPLLADILPAVKKPQAALVMVLLIVLTGLSRIYFAHNKYSERLDWYRAYINANIDSKQMVSVSKLPAEKVVMAWPSPYEFWMLSTLEKDRSASIIFFDDNNSPEWAKPETRAMVTTWGAFPYKELDKRYFKFTDSFSAYNLIK